MSKYLYSFFILLSFFSSAQFLEFGANAGISSYAGDLRRGYNLSNPSLGIAPVVRFNFSEIVSARISLLATQLSGVEKPIDALGVQRNQSFESSLIELSAVFEYHFLDFKTENSRFKYSPYIFGGFGIINYPGVETIEEVNSLQPVFPFGGGIKYLFQKKYSIGLELGARKTFFDYLDGVSDDDILFKDEYRFGNPNDDDWYFFTAITFSIILFDIPCPHPYTPNKSILAR